MQAISLDAQGIMPFVDESEIELLEEKIYQAHDMLELKTGAGRNMLRVDKFT